MRLPAGIHASLVLRTTLLVLGSALVVGVLALVLAGSIAERWERTRLTETVAAQLAGVASDAGAACFAGDQPLATQVVHTLVASRSVRAARLQAKGAVLAQASRDGARLGQADLPMTRRIMSPFASDVQLGELSAEPDPLEAARQGRRTAILLRAAVLGLSAVMAAVLAAAVQRGIVRPITSLSERLRRLEAENGALLTAPTGHDRDEIGHLVTGVNGLVENLVSALRRERELGDLVAQDQRRTRAAAETADTGLFVVGADGGLEAWTPAFLRLLGLEQAPPVRGAALAPLFGASRVQVDQSLTRCRAIGAQVMERVAVPGPQPGQQRQLQLCLELAEADRVQGQVEDVTPLVEAPAASAGHALRDPLTGLPNRLGAEEVLTELLAANRDSLALVLVDLDQFKQANANYGARGGDEVLRQTAARIAACLRRSDLAARFGGDEFLLILNAVAEEQQVLKIARKVQDAVGEPMTLPGLAETWVSASVGIVLRHPGGNPSRLNLLKRAEQALDQAKLAGENQVRVYRG